MNFLMWAWLAHPLHTADWENMQDCCLSRAPVFILHTSTSVAFFKCNTTNVSEERAGVCSFTAIWTIILYFSVSQDSRHFSPPFSAAICEKVCASVPFDVVGHHRASFKHTLQRWCWTDKVWWVWRKYSRHGAAEDEERLECCGLNKKTLTIWANGQQLKQVRAGCDSLRPYVRKLREKLGSQKIIERNGEGAKVLTLNMSPSLLSGVTTCNIFIFTTRITPAVVYRAGQCNHKFVLSWIQNKIVQFSKATQCL